MLILSFLISRYKVECPVVPRHQGYSILKYLGQSGQKLCLAVVVLILCVCMGSCLPYYLSVVLCVFLFKAIISLRKRELVPVLIVYFLFITCMCLPLFVCASYWCYEFFCGL